MKKFTKIILIIAGSLAALGIVFGGIATVMGAGWSTIHRKALAGDSSSSKMDASFPIPASSK
jgi:hypothetical protein